MQFSFIKKVRNFGISFACKTFKNKLMLKLTKSQRYQEKYFSNVLNYLDKNYGDILIDKFDDNLFQSNYKVWVFWWQGINSETPEIVQNCIESIKNNFKSHEVVIITKENFSSYVSIPNYILEKMNNKIISITHFSDILRANLLSEYGGVWLDATCFLTGSIEDEIESKLFYTNNLPYEDWLKVFVGKGKWSAFF